MRYNDARKVITVMGDPKKVCSTQRTQKFLPWEPTSLLCTSESNRVDVKSVRKGSAHLGPPRTEQEVEFSNLLFRRGDRTGARFYGDLIALLVFLIPKAISLPASTTVWKRRSRMWITAPGSVCMQGISLRGMYPNKWADKTMNTMHWCTPSQKRIQHTNYYQGNARRV